jgi:hypothetical protein
MIMYSSSDSLPDSAFHYSADNAIDRPLQARPLPWPHWAAQYIEDNYTERGDREIAADLTADPRDERVYNAKMVEKKRLAMNLKRDNMHRRAILQRNKEAGAFRRPEGFEAPHTVQEGDIRVWKERQSDGKVRDILRIKKGGEMVSYSNHVWEEANGPVPAGYIVAFIDGDPLNCELGNLRLLTRAENIARNRNFSKNQTAQRKALRQRADRQRQQYLDLSMQLEAVKRRKERIAAGDVDEKFTVDMIKQIQAELTQRENALLRDIYLLPESAKKA